MRGVRRIGADGVNYTDLRIIAAGQEQRVLGGLLPKEESQAEYQKILACSVCRAFDVVYDDMPEEDRVGTSGDLDMFRSYSRLRMAHRNRVHPLWMAHVSAASSGT